MWISAAFKSPGEVHRCEEGGEACDKLGEDVKDGHALGVANEPQHHA